MCQSFCSVVVPTHRRLELLGRCLNALAAQTLTPAAYEIVVADDAADADTRRQVEEFAGTAAPRVHYVPVIGTHGPAAARNAGWHQAAGRIIAFTDDDCVPDADWLAAGTAHFQDPDVLAIAGKVRVPLPSCPTDYQLDAAGLERADFVTANCFCRRSALEQIGGFDERFQTAWREDSDLHFALLRLPGKVGKADEVAVVHPVRPARWGVSLGQQRKCLFDALLYKKHPDLYRRLIRPGVPWHYYACVSLLLAALTAAAAGAAPVALAGAAGWALMTARFCGRRLRQTSRAPRHVAEMAVTSILIPPLSVCWRLYGAWRFRVFFL
jgi:glycosyltransferase involved in cell wall biosynthesis